MELGLRNSIGTAFKFWLLLWNHTFNYFWAIKHLHLNYKSTCGNAQALLSGRRGQWRASSGLFCRQAHHTLSKMLMRFRGQRRPVCTQWELLKVREFLVGNKVFELACVTSPKNQSVLSNSVYRVIWQNGVAFVSGILYFPHVAFTHSDLWYLLASSCKWRN